MRASMREGCNVGKPKLTPRLVELPWPRRSGAIARYPASGWAKTCCQSSPDPVKPCSIDACRDYCDRRLKETDWYLNRESAVYSALNPSTGFTRIARRAAGMHAISAAIKSSELAAKSATASVVVTP